EAIRELHAALAVTPDDATALWFLGFSLIGQGKPQDAIPPLEQAVSISHGSPGVIGVLARAYGHAGRRSDALRLIDELNRRRQKGYVSNRCICSGLCRPRRLRRGVCLVRTSVRGEVQHLDVDQSGALP